MPRKLVGALALSAVLAFTSGAVAQAVTTTVKAGNLVLVFGGSASPESLPKHAYAPVTTTIEGKISTADGTHPSALREAVVDIDKDVQINVRGLPVCKPGQLEAQDTAAARKVCGATTVGSGLAHAEIAFPEQRPIKVSSPITVFNGGESGGKVHLLIHTFITVPVPAAIVTQVTIQRKGSGIHSIAKIPAIAGGSGSAVDFKFKVGRTYAYKGKRIGYGMAKCPDGQFKAKTKGIFKNETHVPGVPSTTVLSGSLVVPCTPKG